MGLFYPIFDSSNFNKFQQINQAQHNKIQQSTHSSTQKKLQKNKLKFSQTTPIIHPSPPTWKASPVTKPRPLTPPIYSLKTANENPWKICFCYLDSNDPTWSKQWWRHHCPRRSLIYQSNQSKNCLFEIARERRERERERERREDREGEVSIF